ncbi:ABC transporter ATP-binding protein [Candidatus Woesearchaeota archaeon]|nr:ABC transporter ATP-binding protein [Candidatus Woesearchaeota archaeon]
MQNHKEEIDYRYNFKVYFGLLSRYKFIIFFLLTSTLIVETSYTIVNYLFKRVIDDGTAFSAGDLAKADFVNVLIFILLFFLGVLVIRFIAKWTEIHLINRLDAHMMADVKRKYFNHILSLSHSFHTGHKTGSLISRLIRGSGGIERLTDVIAFNVMPLVFQLVIVVGSLAYFDWLSALVVLTTVFLFIVYSVFFQFRQQNAIAIANQTEDAEKANISDFFTNIDSIKYFGKESKIKRVFFKLSENTLITGIRNWDYHRWIDAGQVCIMGLGTLFLVWLPLLKFLDNQLSIGTLVFIYTVYGNLAGPLFGFVWGIRNFYRAMADFEDLFKYGKIEQEVKDEPGADKLKVREGGITFKNVYFGYNRKKELFKNFNLKIPKEKNVALVGPSGCGKSTLIKLLYRLFDVQSGEILIDGKNIKKFKQESLRSAFSIVPQECVLFDDTIYNNIKFSKPDATYEEVMRAMRFAQLDKVVKRFPQQEKTIVGERGVKLSGGEKQRVSIARALLANKKVLVLDEATSALDSETEHDIQKALEKLMEGRTTLMIAHRLSTIMLADLIVVMDKGRIVQIGRHNELIRQEGMYRKLWNLQKGGYIK